jgi:hypothetical protein
MTGTTKSGFLRFRQSGVFARIGVAQNWRFRSLELQEQTIGVRRKLNQSPHNYEQSLLN